jgi:hypothetical protein
VKAAGETYLVGGKYGGIGSGIMDAAEHPPPPPTGARTWNQSTRRGPQLWKGILKRGLVDISVEQGDEQRTLLGASSNKHSERVPGTGRFEKAKRPGNNTITGNNDNSLETASDFRIHFLERKVQEWQASTQRERSARHVLEEDILAKVAEIKLLANAQDEERVQRQRDVEFSAVEGKLRLISKLHKRSSTSHKGVANTLARALDRLWNSPR